MSLDEKFNAACNEIRKFTKRPPDNEILEVYGLYKQATIGNCNTVKPSGDEEKRSKWEAWNAKKGLDTGKAKEQYITKIKSLAPNYA